MICPKIGHCRRLATVRLRGLGTGKLTTTWSDMKR